MGHIFSKWLWATDGGPESARSTEAVGGTENSAHRHILKRAYRSNLSRGHFGAVLVCLLLAFIVALSWQAWRQQNSDTQAEFATISEVGARALDSYLSQLEISLKILAEALASEADQVDLDHNVLKSRAGDLIQQFNRLHIELANISVVQESGLVLVTTNTPNPASFVSIADEESFKQFPRVTLYGIDVGQAMLDYATNRWIVPIRYRVTDRYEKFLYFVSANLPMEFFASFWKDAPITERVTIGILRDDGYLVSRHPVSPTLTNDEIYGKPRDGALIRFLRQLKYPSNGTVIGYNFTVGTEHLNVFRRLVHYPLTLYVTMPMTEVWAAWWARVKIPYLLSVLMLLGGIAVQVISSSRQKKYENSLNRALLASERASRERNIALDYMSHGICMFDAAERLVIANQRYLDIYNFGPGVVVPGMALREIAMHLDVVKVVPYQDHKLAEFHASIAAGRTTHDVRELADGRTIVVTNRPLPDGGWVATHEDITERRRAERKLEQTQTFLNAVIEFMPAILSVKQVTTRTYALVNRAASVLFGYSSEQMVGKNVHQLFSKSQAEFFATQDGEAIRTRGLPVVHEHTVEAPHNGTRVLNTTKLTIPDAAGEPEYLISFSEDITERRKAESNIAHMAHHDALTGLANRVLLRERLESALLSIQRGGSLAVLYLDLDHFKSVNDTLGHSIGDELLKVVGGRLINCVRAADTVARLGGDEFVILLTGLEKPQEAEILASRVREAISAPIELDGQQIVADVSIGISIAPHDATDAEQLLKNADMALYGAKSSGRGTYRFFEPEMDARVKARRAMEIDLRQALADGEFEMYYQPVVDIARDEVVGCEALLRWHHPVRGLISPNEFIPVAEEAGLIALIGEWVLKTACAEAVGWPDHIRLAVNVSPTQFKSQGLALAVVNALAATRLPARRLELEITEAVLLQNNDATLATLRHVHDLGVAIAMDDFGTGYSSLAYLRRFPFHKIKIDRSFVKDLSHNHDSMAIVRAIASLANEMNIVTTAEGVETREQLDKVRELGCTEMQGYLYCRPVPAQELPKFLAGGLYRNRSASAA
jgi:diguanylate cyclase (GGDEF)-like protein/PAS domain S-box-containing protein